MTNKVRDVDLIKFTSETNALSARVVVVIIIIVIIIILCLKKLSSRSRRFSAFSG